MNRRLFIQTAESIDNDLTSPANSVTLAEGRAAALIRG